MTTTTFVDEVTVIEASWLNDVNADVYGVRPVATGGTGATDAADARTNLGLGNVDNTSDANKPVSTAQQAALNLKANLVSPSFTTPSLGVATATSLQGIIGNITPAAGTFTTLTSTGNAALGDAEASDTHAIKGATTLLANSASAALTVTQTGAGNAFVVEDSASTDSTPFVVNAAGIVNVAHPTAITGALAAVMHLQVAKTDSEAIGAYLFNASSSGPALEFGQSNNSTVGSHTVVASGDTLGVIRFSGSDGTNFIRGAQIVCAVDGTPGTNDMPGRLVFSTTADGASTPTERMRIDSAGNVGVGIAPSAGVTLHNGKNITGATSAFAYYTGSTIQSDVTSNARGYATFVGTQVAAFTLNNLWHFEAAQNTFGAGSTVSSQYGYASQSSLTGATNNYGFYSNIASAANRYNFYAAGTAANYFAGSVGVGGIPAVGYKLINYGNYTGSATFYATSTQGTVQSDVTTFAAGYRSALNTVAAAFTLPNLFHYIAEQGSIGAGSAVTNQFGYNSSAGLIAATNNYGFHAANTASVTAGKVAYGFHSAVNTASGGGTTWAFYGAGTAPSFFAGDMQLGKTVTAGGTTGAQTINKTVGTVNFAAAATSLVVTNSLVTANSIITATVGTNDTTMKSVAVVAAAGSFTLHANAAATAETRVNFHVFN